MKNDNAEEILLIIIYHSPSYISSLQIKPSYLSDKLNQILLNSYIESYKKYKTINSSSIYEFIDKNYFSEIITKMQDIENTQIFHESRSDKDLLQNQKSILETYKAREIQRLSDKLSQEEINYDEFKKQFDEISDLEIAEESPSITEEEIRENIDSSKTKIRFKSFPKLSRYLNLTQGDLITIGAYSGTGKTSFLLNLLNDLSKDYKCIYFNAEMSKSNMYRRMIGINANVPIDSIDNPSTYQKEIIDKAIQEISNRKIIMKHDVRDLKEIRAIVMKEREADRHTIVFIDHIGLMVADSKLKSIYEQSTQVAKELREIAMDYGCTVIATSQFNKAALGEEEVNNNMLKDSGEVTNSSRKIILLTYAPNQDKKDLETVMNVDITKNDDGLLGTIQMDYIKIKQIFKEREIKYE